MDVLHISNTDLMGRRFNGYDLLHELKPRGVNGKQVVLDKHSNNPEVIHLLATPEDRWLHQACAAAEQRHSMSNLLFPWGTLLAETAEFKNADVVHLHLIHNNMISLVDLPRIVRMKPCVWTFHDPWPMTGHCIYPRSCQKWLTGCSGCPSLDAIFPMADDCADSMWDIKQRVLADLDVDVVVASEFMLDMVQRSPLTSHLENVHLIPFGVELRTFLPSDRRAASRKSLGIPREDFVVLFRSTSSEYKGLRYIVEALASAPPSRPTTLLTVNERGLVESLTADYNVVEMGWVHDDSLLARLYSACDVLLMPSTAEAFGLMALEAMAASRPVVCFEGTSLPNVTHAPDCGIAVPMEDAVALRSALDALAADPNEADRRGRLGRSVAEEHYSHDRYLDAMTSLYEAVLNRPRSLTATGSRPLRTTRSAEIAVLPSDADDVAARASRTDATTGDSAAGDGDAVRARRLPAAMGGPLDGVRICLVFEYSLSHYTRILREVSALQEAGATVQLLTSHSQLADAPSGMRVTVSPLRFHIPGLNSSPQNPLRESSLRALISEVDLFWVCDFLSLPTVHEATRGTPARVLYETVDLVPEYPHHGEEHRMKLLRGEREIIGDVDGFITACDSYADYYMERYGDSVLSRRPVVCDNTPSQTVSQPRSTERPLRLLFLGNLMFDRPVLELIEAMARVSVDATLTLQGRNDIGEAPLARIAQRGLQNRVTLLDPCPPETIVETASAYDVGIVALRGADENERRASTSKLFTYMSAGLAVLGSDLPGIARVVNEHGNGLLVGGMEPTAWAKAIETLVSLPTSEIDAMKQRSVDAAKQYSWEHQKPAFIAEFQRALGLPGGGDCR